MLQPIPAIDIIDGKCVRLSKGDYDTQKVYADDPLDMALRFEDEGFSFLHMVDLDGAKSSHVVNWRTLERCASHTKLSIDFGGGIKSDDDIRAVFNSGADRATIGSIAVKSPEVFDRWLLAYGPERIILGADVKDGLISINGWKENSAIDLYAFLDTYMAKGITHVLCTDISRDGMLQGTSVELYRQILERYPQCKLIASGGVGSMSDLEALDEAGVPFAVFGKAIYEGRIDLRDVSRRFTI